MTPDPIVRQLLALREAKGLSRTAVAQRAGIARTTLTQAETGRNGPNLVTLRLWADALGADLVLRPKVQR